MRFCLVSAAAVCFIFVSGLPAQAVRNPHASLIDVPARQALLEHTRDPRLLEAVRSLPSCVDLPAVPAPGGPMEIPHHYLHGSFGPTNPAEPLATRPYGDFEHRVNAGMNRWLATGDQREARCALTQLDAWARAGALLQYDPRAYSQSWYQVEWTTSGISIAAAVLADDPALDSAQQKRVARWLNAVAHRLISFDKPNGNNHHYWRGLASIAVGVLSNDNELFAHGVNTYKEAIAEIDGRGAFPQEMARHENAIHYQAFALAPLTLIARFASRQGIDLFGYSQHGRGLRDAITFLGNAVADPALVKPYTEDEQHLNFGCGDFAPFVFYIAHAGSAGLPADINQGIKPSCFSNRIGGNTYVLAASPAS